MAGIPQVREAAWLYAPGNDVPLAHVRLEERMDGSGWDLYLADPASAPEQRAHFADEIAARVELERIYTAGRTDGTWRISQQRTYGSPADRSRSAP